MLREVLFVKSLTTNNQKRFQKGSCRRAIFYFFMLDFYTYKYRCICDWYRRSWKIIAQLTVSAIWNYCVAYKVTQILRYDLQS